MSKKKKMSRQERRQLLKKELKQKMAEGVEPTIPHPQDVPQSAPQNQALENTLKLVIQDIQKLAQFYKVLENRIWLLVDSLGRKEIMTLEDITETERLYGERDKKRANKIKELLASEMNIHEIMEEIHEEPGKPNYEIMNIHPIKDLNKNPYEVGSYIRDTNPDASKEEIIQLGKKWGLTPEHLGYKAAEEAKKDSPKEKIEK